MPTGLLELPLTRSPPSLSSYNPFVAGSFNGRYATVKGSYRRKLLQPVKRSVTSLSVTGRSGASAEVVHSPSRRGSMSHGSPPGLHSPSVEAAAAAPTAAPVLIPGYRGAHQRTEGDVFAVHEGPKIKPRLVWQWFAHHDTVLCVPAPPLQRLPPHAFLFLCVSMCVLCVPVAVCMPVTVCLYV